MFDTEILRDGDTLTGPWREPRQMLMQQSYSGGSSIHDDETAQKLGFKGGTIEGPTHFSQFDPLCHAIWGNDWFSWGSISAHYRSPVFEGEEVQASITRESNARAAISMVKRDGTQVLAGSVSLGPSHPVTALEERLAGLKPLEDPVLLRDLHVGMTRPREKVIMGQHTHMGELYPFTLADKLARITENSPIYGNIIPIEMVSVLIGSIASTNPFPIRRPSVGLFADQEIRLMGAPLKVGAEYEVEREILAMTGSRKTESAWVLSRVYAPGGNTVLAQMLLNTATLKTSYAAYDEEHAALYGASDDG